MKTATIKALDSSKTAIIGQMKTLLMQAKECIPTSKNKPLIALQIMNGCDGLKMLTSNDGKTKYQHSDSIHDLNMAMYSTIDEAFHKELEQNAYKVFGVEMDEETNMSNCNYIYLIHKVWLCESQIPKCSRTGLYCLRQNL